MNLYSSKKVAIFVIACCILNFTIAIPSLQAVDGTRVLTIALFASGMGLKFGSVFVEKSSQDSFDLYLNAAVQGDIAKHREDYTNKRDSSAIMSRIGVGFVGLAAMISIFDNLNLISKSSRSSSTSFRLTPSYNLQKQETKLLLQRRF
jgi:hypothetical protein